MVSYLCSLSDLKHRNRHREVSNKAGKLGPISTFSITSVAPNLLQTWQRTVSRETDAQEHETVNGEGGCRRNVPLDRPMELKQQQRNDSPRLRRDG